MLELKQIKKDYPAGGETVHALKGVSLQFRQSEFVSILGPSGCVLKHQWHAEYQFPWCALAPRST